MDHPKVTLLVKWRLAAALARHYGGTVAIGLRLLNHFNAKTGRCDPSYATLAEGTGMGRRQAIRCVEQLIADGFLKIIEERKGTSNRFEFAWERAGDINVTPTGVKDDTSLVSDTSLPSDTDDTTSGVKSDTQNLLSRNSELNLESKQATSEENEKHLTALIGPIDSGLDLDSEFVKPRRPEQHSAEVAIERALYQIEQSTTAGAALFKLIPKPAMDALVHRCINGKLTRSTIARVAAATR